MIAALIALAAIALLLFLPLGARAEYKDDLRVWLCIGPLRLTLYPAKKKKPKKPKAEKPKKEEKPKEEKEKKPLPPVRTLLDYASLALDLLGRLWRRICIRELTIRATFGGADAGDAAIGYGRAWAAIGAVTPILERAFRIKKRNLSAEYDPECKEIRLYACAQATINLFAILQIAFRALSGWLKIRKAVKHNDESDQ
ncbi:MAG: DUF2953 domain-containing protein [Oscillospiraceae bacterium]|nr:DUF2953 domain-containing protein [Oscillospiraceae bacterium]